MDQVNNEQQAVKVSWFNKNFKKIVFSLATIGAVTGTIGMVLGSVSVNKTNELSYYLDRDYTAVWGKGTVWQTENASFKFVLYISPNKKSESDIKWDGKYPKGYFYDEK